MRAYWTPIYQEASVEWQLRPRTVSRSSGYMGVFLFRKFNCVFCFLDGEQISIHPQNQSPVTRFTASSAADAVPVNAEYHGGDSQPLCPSYHNF